MTANGEVQTREEATVYFKQRLDLFVKVLLLKLCEDHGFSYHWTSGQKPHLIRNGKRIECKFSNYVPFVVPGLSASSSSITLSPVSPSSSSQDSVFDVNRYTENPLPGRSGSTSEELRRNPLPKPTGTENKNKNEGREEVQSDLLYDLLDWLQEFRENLVDERGPLEPRETWAWISRHFQFFSWTSNGAASKSGTGLSTRSSSSSSPTSLTSSSQEAVTHTQHPASTRSESVSDAVRGNSSRGPAETENPKKNDDNEKVRGDSSHGVPEWLEEFKKTW